MRRDEADIEILEPTGDDLEGFRPEKVKGEEYRSILERVTKILFHQKEEPVRDGIKGFIFHGDVGLGKTFLSKALARKANYDLIFVDGSTIARPRYGEAESQISEIFQTAEENRNETIILIDDCESVFPKRDWMKGESWHVAQNNVFFHELDNLDTSKTAVILTTNRYDLLDKAVKDRLHNIEFPQPGEETLKEIAKQKAKKLRLSEEDLESVQMEIEENGFKSIRALEDYIMERYLETI